MFDRRICERSARPIVPGTVARGHLNENALLYTGKLNGADATVFPFPVDARVMARGRERFDIFCSPCHGRTGQGDGMVVRRGYRHPPTYHQDRLRSAPVGHFFDVITNGFGAMPDYAAQVPAELGPGQHLEVRLVTVEELLARPRLAGPARRPGMAGYAPACH